MEVATRRLRYFRTQNGRAPFWDWLDGMKDRTGQAGVLTRLDRLEDGNFGDHRSVGGGVIELRLQLGPGYRIYLGKDGPVLIILLCGGDKKTQARDIGKARMYWKLYRTGGI
jgi:putative addiction module killer protein